MTNASHSVSAPTTSLPMQTEMSSTESSKEPSLLDVLRSDTPVTQNLCLDFVRRNGLDVAHVPLSFRTMPVLLAAVQQNGLCIQFFSEDDWYGINRSAESAQGEGSEAFALEMALIAVSQDGNCLSMIPKKLRTDTVIKAGLEQDGWALQYLQPDEISHDARLVALQQSGFALRFIDSADRTPDLCLTAILNAFPVCKILNLPEYTQEGSERLQGIILANWDEFVQIQGEQLANEIRQSIESSPLFEAAKALPRDLTNLTRLTLNDMGVLPGTPLLIRNLEGNSKQQLVQFIGSILGQGIFIDPLTGASDSGIKNGETYIVQGFTGKHSFSFLAKILHAIDAPFSCTIIEYPLRLDSVRVRSALRVKSDWPAFLLRPNPKIKDAFIENPVRLHDMSLKGARVVSDSYIGYIGQKIQLRIKVQVNGDLVATSVEAEIRHISQQSNSSQFFTGVQFSQTALDQKMAINYLMSMHTNL